jgi:hypothetical protein
MDVHLSLRPIAAALLALAAAGVAGAAPVCLERPEPLVEPLRFPLGCELVDCCPGCPGDGPIDLRVRLSGAGLRGAELRLPTPEGEERMVRLAPGETLVRGVARARDRAAPVAELRLDLPRPSAGPVEVELSQLLGLVIVNDLFVKWSVLQCLSPGPCDRIVESGKLGGDRSVVMLDARRASGCVNDEVLRLDGSGGVGSVQSNGACRSELAIFAEGNAMRLDEAVASWRDPCGDAHPAPLKPLLAAPATFFLAVPDLLAQLQWAQTADQIAKLDLDHANDIYDVNKTGISITMTPEKLTLEESAELLALLPQALLQALAGAWDPISLVCNMTKSLQSAGYYVPGRLNVYYVPVPGRGMTCPDDRNIVFIALERKPETLAHEFGHSFSLLGQWGHTNGVPGFDSSNVMWGGSDDLRSHFSLGQAFRLNVACDSTLNVNQVRQGPVRSCPMTVDSPACPRLDLDWGRP